MTVKVYNSTDHEFKIAVSDSIEEFDTLAGKSGAALEAAVMQEVMHGTLGDIRDAFQELIEEETKIAPLVTNAGTDDEEQERFSVYYNRVCSTLGKNPKSKPFQHLADRLSHGGDKEVKFDPSAKARTGTGPKTTKKYLINARQLLTSGKVEKFQKMALARNITFTLVDDLEQNVKVVAAALKQFVEAPAAEALAQALA